MQSIVVKGGGKLLRSRYPAPLSGFSGSAPVLYYITFIRLNVPFNFNFIHNIFDF